MQIGKKIKIVVITIFFIHQFTLSTEMKPSKITLQHLYNQGMTDSKESSRRSEIPLRTVQRDLPKMKQGISLKRKVGSGRSKALNGQDTRRLLQLVVKDDMRTSTDLKLELVKR